MSDEIQLDRRFLELKSGEDDNAAEDRALFGLRDDVSWDSILKERCAVILGEAGTGKTTEFRLRCKLLAEAEAGSPAFFLPVEDLATERVTELSRGGDRRRAGDGRGGRVRPRATSG